MRVHDQPVPAVVPLHRPPPGALLRRLWVAVEKTLALFPRWDDGVTDWDGGEGDEFWDAAGPGVTTQYLDAVCDLQGLEFTTGSPDAEGNFEAGELHMTLNNRRGLWSQYDPAGRIVDYLPGRRIAVWADVDGAPWWLWCGVITAWRELADHTIDVDASDDFTVANVPLGLWTPGATGDTVPQRLGAVLDRLAPLAYTPVTRFDAGDVTLLTVEGDDTALEAMQRAVVSDGGVLHVDADGTLVARDRRWPAGRDDQESVPVLSDNVCTSSVDAVVWDPVITTDDEAMVNVAVLANIADPPIQVTGTNTASGGLHGPLTLPKSRTEELWQTEIQGQALADYLVARRGDAYLRVESAALWLTDPRHDLWRLGIDRRLGDVVEFVRDAPTQAPRVGTGYYGTGSYGASIYGPPVALEAVMGRLDVFLCVQQITHTITPSSWVVTLATTRVTNNRPVQRWDESPFHWDEDNPLNAWSP